MERCFSRGVVSLDEGISNLSSIKAGMKAIAGGFHEPFTGCWFTPLMYRLFTQEIMLDR